MVTALLGDAARLKELFELQHMRLEVLRTTKKDLALLTNAVWDMVALLSTIFAAWKCICCFIADAF